MMIDEQKSLWDSRAEAAENSVNSLFGARFFRLPKTWIARSFSRPSSQSQNQEDGDTFRSNARWDYWWQAHYLDCLVDAAYRDVSMGRSPEKNFGLAYKLLRTIWIRNFFHFSNYFYDDMAWLALAVYRLDKFNDDFRRRENQNYQNNRLIKKRKKLTEKSLKALKKQLKAASTDHLDGGVFWNKDHNFKNTPATAPVAIFEAWIGDDEGARDKLKWFENHLMNENGLIMDGLKTSSTNKARSLKKISLISVDEENLELIERVYSYNQGTVLGAFLALGDDKSLRDAENLISKIYDKLSNKGVLKSEGGMDGGLFTGILVRYLASAAINTNISEKSREKAREMVFKTSDVLWLGRRESSRGAGSYVFSSDTDKPAVETYPKGSRVELTTQLQAWMCMESAFRVS